MVVSTIKETSVLSVITVGELTYQGLIVQGRTFGPFEVFITTATIYWLVTSAAAAGMRSLEHRIAPADRKKLRPSTQAHGFLTIEA